MRPNLGHRYIDHRVPAYCENDVRTVVRAPSVGPTRGTSRLSGSDEADTRKGGKPHDIGKGKSAASKGRPGDVGRALRSVYDDTLREEIPIDLQDLLGRLD